MCKIVAVSACLLGVRCRYDGKCCYNKAVIEYLSDKLIIPVCPEIYGGLETPREACEISNNDSITKVISIKGADVSDSYITGAEEALKKVKRFKADEAILKSLSPSCGLGMIYDGSFTKRIIAADGIFVRLLKRENIPVKTEKHCEKELTD